MCQAGHSLSSKQDIPCSTQDILFVPRMAFPVFQAGHSFCSTHDIPCFASNAFLVFPAGLSLGSKQDMAKKLRGWLRF